ncbi:unnamed protein product [Caenorhabditis sp. 36 PRJEB53466]|nr:unnamed protein product [Caenorhabditis sp. 36 PRJEB53466]
MKPLLSSLILSIFIIYNNVIDACLRIQSEFEVPDGCNCSMPQAIDASGIGEMSDSSQYLASRITVKPNFYVAKTSSGCRVFASAKNMPAEYNTFYFMIFTKNSPPLIQRKFSPLATNDRNAEFVLNGLHCNTNFGQWEYYGVGRAVEQAYLQRAMDGLSFALQAERSEADYCRCTPPSVSDKYGTLPTLTFMPGSCDAFTIDCGHNSSGVYLTSTTANDVILDYGASMVGELMCVSDGSARSSWWHNNIRMDNLEVACRPGAVQASWSYTPNCGTCVRVEFQRLYENFKQYDPSGRYAFYDWAAGSVDRLVSPDPNVCVDANGCAGTLFVTLTNNTIVERRIPVGHAAFIDVSCAPNPNSDGFGAAAATYATYIDNSLVNGALTACVNTTKQRPAALALPDGFECPVPGIITDEAEIAALPNSAYLSKRFSVAPLLKFSKRANETGECQVEATCINMPAEHTHFYMMIFRSNGAPIFARRFFPGGNDRNDPFAIYGLFCREDSETRRWQYFGADVDEPKFACQAEEAVCKCAEFEYSDKYGLRPDVVPFGDLCDTISVSCGQDSGLFILSSNRLPIRMESNNITIREFTCVSEGASFVWYHNNLRLESVELTCRPNSPSIGTAECRSIQYLDAEDVAEYDVTGFFEQHQREDGFYSGTDGLLERYPLLFQSEFLCSSRELVLFRPNYEPLTINQTADGLLYTRCGQIPLSDGFGARPGRGTFVRGELSFDARFACFNSSKEVVPSMPAACKCPIPGNYKSSDANFFAQFANSDYVSARLTVAASLRIVAEASSDGCVVNAACRNMESTHAYLYLMIFRADGPPIFERRFTPYDNTDRNEYKPVQGLACSTSASAWTYYGSPIDSPTFACQADTDSICKCAAPKETTRFGSAPTLAFYKDYCDTFTVDCGDDNVILYSSSAEPIKLDISTAMVRELTCVDSNGQFVWFHNNVQMSDLEISCQPRQQQGFISYCGCRQAPFLTADTISAYDVDDTYTSSFKPAPYTSSVSGADFCGYEVNCEGTLVVFTPNWPTLLFNSTYSMRCEATPLSASTSSSAAPNYLWYVRGQMRSDLAYACLEPQPSDVVPMGACACPPIRYIDQETVKRAENSKYLGERETIRPTVRIGDECQIAVSCETAQFDDFYFMIFRDNDPPIFNRRFVPGSDKTTAFVPTGLQCVQTAENEMEWQYFGGKLTNISFALQSNTEKCECTEWANENAEVSKKDGICDMMEVKCTLFTNLAYLFGSHLANIIALPKRQNNLVEELTCVNDGASYSWYYAGIKTTSIRVWCSVPMLAGQPINASWHCGCPDFVSVKESNAYLEAYNQDGLLSNYKISEGHVDYGLAANCAPTFTCDEATTLAVLSTNRPPMMYEVSSPPYVTCEMSPLASDSALSSSFWYVDGVMITEPGYACLTSEDY